MNITYLRLGSGDIRGLMRCFGMWRVLGVKIVLKISMFEILKCSGNKSLKASGGDTIIEVMLSFYSWFENVGILCVVS